MKTKTLLTAILTVFTAVLFSHPQLSFTGNVGNPVIEPSPGTWDAGSTFTPDIINVNDTFYLFYSGAIYPWDEPLAIGYATSTDGLSFTKETVNAPIFEADGSGFDAWSVADPIVTLEGSTWVLYYGAVPSSSETPPIAIGKATAPDVDGPWSRLDVPILELGSSGEWDSFFIIPSSIITTETGYMIYYWAGDDYPVGRWCIGLATSPDGENWTKYDDPTTTSPPFAESDPILEPGLSGQWDDDAIDGCNVLKTAYGYEMFYAGWSDNTNSSSIGYATSLDGITWIKDIINNPIYSWIDDPYASYNSYMVLEIPTVVVNDSTYYMYYDYFPIIREIGMATANVLTSIINVPDNQNNFELSIFPNPFSNQTTIQFTLPESEFVIISIYDITGKQMFTFLSKELHIGNNEINWNAKELRKGIYFIQLKTNYQTITKKVILLK